MGKLVHGAHVPPSRSERANGELPRRTSARRYTTRPLPSNRHRASIPACYASALVLLTANAAAAHLPMLRGKLVELVRQSDCIVIGTVNRVRAVDARRLDTTMTVEHQLAGTLPESTLTFRGSTRVAMGERYVFFLHRVGLGFDAVQDPGTVFPVIGGDVEGYRRTIEAVARALQGNASNRDEQLRAALIPALSASAGPLRYHAALDLAELTEHGSPPGPDARAALLRVLASPGTDPALRPLLIEAAGVTRPPAETIEGPAH